MSRCLFCGCQTTSLTGAYEQCGKCDLWISKVPAADYDDTYYYAKDFRTTDSLHRAGLLFDYFRQEILGKKCLDFGCGDGSFVVTANRNGTSIVGVDINKSVLAVASKFGEEGFYHSNELKSKFSCITSFDVIEHLDNLEDYFRDVNRWLEPNGTLIITTPNKNSKWYSIFKEGWHGLGIPQYHRYVFSLSFLRQELTRYGYSLEKSFSVPPINKNRWKRLISSGYRLKNSTFHKLFSLPYIFCKFVYGKFHVKGEEDTLCLVARRL